MNGNANLDLLARLHCSSLRNTWMTWGYPYLSE